ncbi:MAG: substrate-binding domain-containing protein, partial [Planctomycetes bacterium]|nr:substrate-binding domain-containing protein [Planctomycetota bacterium]
MPKPPVEQKKQLGAHSLLRFLDNNRALLMLVVLFSVLSVFAPNFFSVYNITSILKGASLNAIVAIGFTVIFILGRLDLSIGAVVMLSGMLAIGLQPQLGWFGSISVAILAGACIGLVNGLLVVKARINSFIVTLGTMTVVTGLMHLYSKGGSKAIDDFRFGDWLETPLIPFMAPIVIITLVMVLGFALFLNRTPLGRAFYIVGGNAETAWLAGLRRDRYLIAGFIICSTTAAIGGVLFAAGLSSMTSAAILGNRTLMTVLSAVIIGGALMSGGKGSVLKSYFAVLMLTTLFNGIGCFGLGFEVQIFTNGIILAAVVLYEAFVIYRHDLLKGQRPDLVEEARQMPDSWPAIDQQENGDQTMTDKDRFAWTCITIVAIVGIVAIFAMYFMWTNARHLVHSTNCEQASIDVYALKGTDNQPLILLQTETATIPERPADPSALGETDKGHWWDIEFAGWDVAKVSMPKSPKDGPVGKRIVLLKAGDHPYWTAYVNGFKTIAKNYGMKVKIYNSNWDIGLQAQQTDQAINEKPDMIIFAPVDATACTPLLRRINKAKIP